MKLKGATCLVTGAASGIGRQTALLFAERGARVIGADVDEAGLARLGGELGAGHQVLTLDVSNAEAWRVLRDEFESAGTPIDVLVNNAGVGLAGGILSTTLADWEWILGINLRGVVQGCHFFAPGMVARGRGHIVNVSSLLGYLGAPDTLAYCTTKFAVFGLSEALRAELGPHGVGVSTICPGIINTNIVKNTRYRVSKPTEIRDRVSKLYEQRNYGPERVALAIAHAVVRNRAVVPVTSEAWAAYYVKRAAPGLTPWLGRAIRSRTTGEA